jgi:hypothetical protein
MQAKYIVASKKNRTTRTFTDAQGVAAFMLGRYFDEWCIYQRQDNLPTEVIKCRALLELREGTMEEVVPVNVISAK